ncbi:MAG: hypothetical protein H7141_07600 [Burkholderiales bacterium]|nr:hypothetical protein [Bacteroidia bacterium]
MKTIIKKSFTMLAIGFLFSLNLKANENPKSILLSETNKAIKEHIKFPNLLLHFNQEEKVNVVFTVDEIGKVNLVIANTTNDSLKKLIESQFMKLRLENLKADNAYSVVFNFKTI